MQNLIRSLDFKATTALVVGTVIGTGVFLKAGIMSHQAGAPMWVLLAWVVAGLLSLAGAFCYAELGGLFPRAGGEYVFLREAYGDLVGYLYGWMRFWIGSPGSIAAYGVGAATFLRSVTDLGDTVAVALGFVIFFTLLNCFSVAFGGRIQAFLTALKVLMVLGLVVAIFTVGQSNGTFAHLFPQDGQWNGISSFGAALLAALWAYDGWNNMPMAAGEVKDPERTIPKALIFGMTGVLLIYLLANLAFFYALPFSEVLTANSNLTPDGAPVATMAATAALGPSATIVMSLAFVVSALGAMNGSILTGARVPYAMAKDGLFIDALARVNAKSHTPVVAVLVQGFLAAVLASTGSFDQLTNYVVFSAWIFYALAAASLIIFRRRLPQAKRAFKVPLYPWLPIVFVTLSVLLLINTAVTSPQESLIGLGLIALGVPAFYFFNRDPASRSPKS